MDNKNIQKGYYNRVYRNTKQYNKITQREGGCLDATFNYVQLTNGTILELGCGDGHLTQYLLTKFPKCTVTAVDISDEAIKRLSYRFRAEVSSGQLKTICGDIIEYLDNTGVSYDLIAGSGILHHVDKNRWARLFRGLKEVLNEKGMIILAPEPNVNGYLRYVWKTAHFLYNNIYKISYDRDAEKGTFDMKPQSIINTCNESGFCKVEILPYKYIPNFGNKILEKLDHYLVKYLPGRYATYIRIVLEN